MKTTEKFKKDASRRWVQRQCKDTYVQQAKMMGYRSRSAYKLIDIDKRFSILSKHHIVLDLGSAPGGWSQVASQKGAKTISIDLNPIVPIENVHFIQCDFIENKSEITELLIEKKVNVVMSDASPCSCGIQKIDSLRSSQLAYATFDLAKILLRYNGTLITKILHGGHEVEVVKHIKLYFKDVKYFKPTSSRKESSEIYIVATGFKATKVTQSIMTGKRKQCITT